MSFRKPLSRAMQLEIKDLRRQATKDLKAPWTGNYPTRQDKLLNSGGDPDLRGQQHAAREARIAADLEHRRRIKQELADNPYISQRPAGWVKPPFKSEEYMEEFAYKRISLEEFYEDERLYNIRRKRALAGMAGEGREPTLREMNPEPYESRQYANHMSTQAARDSRLVPMARVALQWIRAKAGTGIEARFTKHSLAAALGVSVRSAQRYLSSLRQFGYIDKDTRTNDRGRHTGVIAYITDKVLPFWRDDKKLGAWLLEVENLPQPFDWTGAREAYPQQALDLFTFEDTRETKVSPKNYSPNGIKYMEKIAPLIAGMYLSHKLE